MKRGLACTTFGLLSLACAHSGSPAALPPPATLHVATATVRSPALGLPFHDAAIVDLALLPPSAGEQWRLASGDADGWVRIWADGRLLAVHHAHGGGLTALRLAADGRWYTAGADGRVLEWQSDALTPTRSLTLGPAITAIAISGPALAVSDGRHVQLWSRDGEPELLWQTIAHDFVTGLALSPNGVLAAAELRQWALGQGIANHPLARFDDGPQTPSPEQQAALRAAAARDFPGATADFVEVWQPGQPRAQSLTPRAPIDGDIDLVDEGRVLVYREIYSNSHAGLVGRLLLDRSEVPLRLAKPWVFWTDADGLPIADIDGPQVPVGDFRQHEDNGLLVVDLFEGWGSEPPTRGWRVGANRELATSHHHAALGDGEGNLAVVAWARPAEAGWQAPTEARFDLLAGARSTATIVSATLEPRTHYRVWDLEQGQQRSLRIEAPWHVLPDNDELALYPSMLSLDAEPLFVFTSMSSYAGDQQAALRVLRISDGVPHVLSLADSPSPIDIAITPDAAHLLAWTPGAAAHSWTAPQAEQGWQPGPDALGGVPRFSASGRWSAHVSAFERHVVDLVARTPVLAVRNDEPGTDLGAGTLAAIANDGTLAVVQPFGGGTLERLKVDGSRSELELPGAATALIWVAEGSEDPAAQVLVIGFADGTIARLDADTLTPIDAGAGGRVWELAAIGRPRVFVELDDRGLTLHRLGDDATVELHLADTTALSRWDRSGVQAASAQGIIAIWRSSSATPPCRVLDGTGIGVLAEPSVEHWPVERAAELFGAFISGAGCEPAAEAPSPEAPSPEAPSSETPGSETPSVQAPSVQKPSVQAPRQTDKL